MALITSDCIKWPESPRQVAGLNTGVQTYTTLVQDTGGTCLPAGCRCAVAARIRIGPVENHCNSCDRARQVRRNDPPLQ